VRLPAQELEKIGYELIEPDTCNLQDISNVPGKDHIDRVRNGGHFEAASLAAGGAICAAKLAMEGEPAFALIRPRGITLMPIGLGESATSITWPSSCGGSGLRRRES
jgi:hypothetical protein